MAYLFSARHRFEPAFSREGRRGIRPALIAVALTILLQVGFTYLKPLQQLFGTRDLDIRTCGIIALASILALILVEAEKAVLRRVLRHDEQLAPAASRSMASRNSP
jgi:multisubunit Na+/H+ antiporter MnhE subunit